FNARSKDVEPIDLSQDSKENNAGDSKENKVILNVGGAKYEAYKSTFTAYPETLLGSMFSESNKSPTPSIETNKSHPIKLAGFSATPLAGFGQSKPFGHSKTQQNEYFFDRDGQVFRYIMQFYRTGKIVWREREDSSNGITRQEIEDELKFFKIPKNVIELNPITKIMASRINEFTEFFMKAIEKYIYTGYSKENLTFAFYEDGTLPTCCPILIKPFLESQKFNDFQYIGFTLLQGVGDEIGKFLKNEIPQLQWSICIKDRHCFVNISITNPFISDKELIILNSCLEKTRCI
ncbi:3205_t:CDS:2, partial [Scutellospora calospora]